MSTIRWLVLGGLLALAGCTGLTGPVLDCNFDKGAFAPSGQSCPAAGNPDVAASQIAVP